MGYEEHRAKVLGLGEGHVELHQEVNAIQGDPAHGENRDHGNQHEVGPLLALELQLLFLLAFAGTLPVGQDDPDLHVRVCDHRERNQILKHNRGQVKEASRRCCWPGLLLRGSKGESVEEEYCKC